MPTEFSLASSVAWLQNLLLGGIATSFAILAIASIGLLMLSGRIPTRRGATTILGCFILFSADMIANGIVDSVAPQPIAVADTAPAPAYTPSVPKVSSYDPYAGASVPDERTKDIFR